MMESNSNNFSNSMANFQGITYPQFLGRFSWQRKLWKKLCCSRQIHLFDEVVTSGGSPFHYLSCDACDMMVAIDQIFPDWQDASKHYKEPLSEIL